MCGQWPRCISLSRKVTWPIESSRSTLCLVSKISAYNGDWHPWHPKNSVPLERVVKQTSCPLNMSAKEVKLVASLWSFNTDISLGNFGREGGDFGYQRCGQWLYSRNPWWPPTFTQAAAYTNDCYRWGYCTKSLKFCSSQMSDLSGNWSISRNSKWSRTWRTCWFAHRVLHHGFAAVLSHGELQVDRIYREAPDMMWRWHSVKWWHNFPSPVDSLPLQDDLFLLS